MAVLLEDVGEVGGAVGGGRAGVGRLLAGGLRGGLALRDDEGGAEAAEDSGGGGVLVGGEVAVLLRLEGEGPAVGALQAEAEQGVLGGLVLLRGDRVGLRAGGGEGADHQRGRVGVGVAAGHVPPAAVVVLRRLQPVDGLADRLVVAAERGERLHGGGRLVGVDLRLRVAVGRRVGAERGEGTVLTLLAGQPVDGLRGRLDPGGVLREQREGLAVDAVVGRVAVAVQARGQLLDGRGGGVLGDGGRSEGGRRRRQCGQRGERQGAATDGHGWEPSPEGSRARAHASAGLRLRMPRRCRPPEVSGGVSRS